MLAALLCLLLAQEPVPVTEPVVDTTVTVDQIQPVAGKVVFKIRVVADQSTYTESTLDLHVDGVRLGGRVWIGSSRPTQNTFDYSYAYDTTQLADGDHGLRYTIYARAKTGDTRNYLRYSRVFTFNTANGIALRDVRANFSMVYLIPGETVRLTAAGVSCDGGIVQIPPRFTYDNNGTIQVDAAGTVTAFAYGTAEVRSYIESQFASTWVVVTPRRNVPHFGKDGTILTQYDPAKSIFVASMFGLDGAALDKDPLLPAAVKSSGINTLTTGFYQSRADGSGTDAQSRNNNTRLVDRILASSDKYDMSLILAGDDMCRTAAEMLDSISNPVSGEIIGTTMKRLKASNRVIGIEMADEINSLWGDNPRPNDGRWRTKNPPNPDDAWTRLLTVMGDEHPARSFPQAAGTSAVAIQNWNRIADYISIYFDPTTYSVSADGRVLPDYWFYLSQKNAAFASVVRENTPKLFLGWVDGPTYFKKIEGGEFNPVADRINTAGCGPDAVVLNIWGSLICEGAGVREYGFDTTSRKNNRLTRAVGSTSSVSTGADPFKIGVDRWNAMASALGVAHKIVPQLYGRKTHSPDLGEYIPTAARTGPNGNLLLAANYREDTEPVRIDLEPYKLAGEVQRYLVTAGGSYGPVVILGREDRISLKPGQCLAYVFKP